MEGWLTDIESKVTDVHGRPSSVQQEAPVDKSADIIGKLNNIESMFSGHVSRLEFNLDSTATKLKDDATNQRDKIKVVSAEVTYSHIHFYANE